MNIDNSGSSIVIDPKSQAAIDAVRDRINLLESENARLTKLQATLTDAVRKAEAELAYKTEQLDEVTNTHAAAVISLNTTLEFEAKTRETVKELQSTEEQIKRDLDEQATAITERERLVTDREIDMRKREVSLARRGEILALDEMDVDAKKAAIQELLTKL
jgi:chromosome segregation ATPase